MNGLERAYILRVLALLSILANVVLGLWLNIFDEERYVYIIFIVLALPLFVFSHIIVKRYGNHKSLNNIQKVKNEQMADKLFARLMFTWFSVVVGGFGVAVFFLSS